jgi:hypothetical protein
MHLIVEQHGCFVSKHQERLRVEKDKQRLAEMPRTSSLAAYSYEQSI